MPNLEWSMRTDPTQQDNLPTMIGTGSTFSVRIRRMATPVPDTFMMLATVSLDFDSEWVATVIGFMGPEEFWLAMDAACAFHPLAWARFATDTPPHDLPRFQSHEISIFPPSISVEWGTPQDAGIIYVGRGPTVQG